MLKTVWITGLILAKFKLCTDIGKNPGPSVYVDATKTINAPYCQGNVTEFGKNGGKRCVAMSLCALIYSKIIWLQACLHWRCAYFQTLSWNDTIFVVVWDILYKLCGSANKWSKGFVFSGKIWWQFFSCNKACSKYRTRSTTTPKYTLTQRLVPFNLGFFLYKFYIYIYIYII